MTKEEQKRIELKKLAEEFNPLHEKLIDEYKKTHKIPSRGVIDTPKLRALRKEELRRFKEILDKYKD